MGKITIFDAAGNRKYLTPEERERFYIATGEVSKDWRAFGRMLYFTGCRISEALNLKVKDIDFSSEAVTINTLKQRRDGVYRQVPLSENYLSSLDDAFDLRMLQKRSKPRNEYVWGWSRRHGYRVIMDMMGKAQLTGIQSTPKGLRHGFAIACLDKGLPLNMVQKWMGHSSIETTAIYANATGQEERKLLAKLWQ